MLLVNFLSGLAEKFGETNSQGCFYILLDEPKCPKCLIK